MNIKLNPVLLTVLSLFLTAPAFAAAAPPPDNSAMQTLTMLVVGMGFFYFIVFRPEQQKRKEMDQKRGALKKGDTVVAIGIRGSVQKILEDSVVIKSANESLVEVLKVAITDVVDSKGSKRVDFPKS